MAYCRFGSKCAVYMYASINGGFMFHTPSENVLIDGADKALEKLKSLQNQGFMGLEDAIDRLEREIAEGKHTPESPL